MERNKKSFYGAMATAVFAALISTNCKNKVAEPDTSPKQYDVLQLATQTTNIYAEYPATLQGEQVIEVRSKIEGYLEELYVDEGATVKKGQRLFRISSPQYEQELRSAEAGIKTAEADVAQAQMSVVKAKPLVEKEIISKYELESAEYTLQAKKAALSQARATVANAKANLGYTMIIAPANGVIGSIPYKKGSLVSGTSENPLTTLSVDKNMYAYFAFNEKQLLEFDRTYKGNTIQEKIKQLPAVQLVLSDGSLYSSKGKIETASGLLSTETGSLNFRAIFPNALNLLKSGASASIQIPQDYKDAILIPQSATYELQDKKLVYVLGKNNMVLSKAITSTSTNNGQFYLVNSGLAAGDKIVLSGITSLKDSIVIKPNLVSSETIFNKSLSK
jgi:membrane fusion protein (multidrug efflux system)